MLTDPKLKVINSVVCCIPIDVVDSLIGQQRSSKVLSHDKTMFKYVSLDGRHRKVWMFRLEKDMNIAVRIKEPASFPPTMTLTCWTTSNAISK